MSPEKRYNHRILEKKWQKYWKENETFRAETGSEKPKYYVLDMFPYPSGAGLHVGHPEGYTATDIIARYKRMRGFEVLHPMGWDAFGLPAENYAIKTGQHPEKTTKENIATFKRQIQSLGFSYDWSREFSTTDSEYYHWTQWIFLKMYKKGLLYEQEMPMNWCPKCRIVAANEEVEGGCHERCGAEVERRNLKQWMFRITEYADRLLEDLEELEDWPEKIIAMQKNWIGRSEGIEIEYPIEEQEEVITCYTTRPDTNFGATFVVLAPEHNFLKKHLDTLPNKTEVEKYRQEATKKSDIDRMADGRKKTGVFTGLFVRNRLNDKKLPLYVGDFVLAHVGTGAVVGVPGHDKRDFEFAQEMGIDVIRVVVSPDGDKSPIENIEQVQEVAGTMINSEFLDGLPILEAKEKIMDYLVKKGQGTRKVNYKLRDWIFTRQRYWGEPIPLVRDEEGSIYPLDESELPITLPETNNFLPTESGKSPLAKIQDWGKIQGDIQKDGSVKLSKTGSQIFFRETSTMPNWAGSNWYWLRFMDAQNTKQPWSPKAEQYWGPVDLYVGGAEHAVLHLLYSRFWHKVFFDLGLVSTKEPFKKLMNQGLILAEDGQKMSKSLGNVVNPDEIVEQYGADTLRMYEMFMGPFEQNKAWNTNAAEGMYKFLQRIWRTFHEKEIIADACPGKEFQKLVHKTVKKITHDIEEFKFNTAISQLMILVNAMQKASHLPRNGATKFVQILSPFAPHLAEELWRERLEKTESITYSEWPTWDETLTKDEEIEIAVQVCGKLRGSIKAPADITKENATLQAKELENVQRFLEGKHILKEIYVPGKIVNIVAK
ncbi:leucine--tRNA ligase [Candidatus Peregrinibacteria bacterium]|nr:MAG: leucine--tRNA ligase [Candidatus Peregrinibacteria bacterium]